ncbi:MAG: glycosyltransferase [Planctomycetota bacterium]
MAADSLRILHIITRLVRGGAQLVVRDLVAGLIERGHTLAVVAGEETGSEGSLWPELAALRLELVRAPSLVRAVQPFSDVRALGELRRAIRAFRPDVVHAHTSKAGFLGCLAARKERVGAIVLAPHGHIIGADAQIPGVPAHGFKRWILKTAARRNCKYADVVVAPNDFERTDGVRLRMWTNEQCRVVPNGVDVERFAPRARAPARAFLQIPIDARVVFVVARLTREKGVDVAVRALEELPGVTMCIAGDGPERAPLEALAAERGVSDRVRLLGLRTDVAEILPAADVVAVPSRTEAHGLVAAEALACELPVVASAVGGLQSLVLDGDTGLLVSPNDASRLAGALRRILDDRPFALELAARGLRHIRAHFSHAAMIERTIDIYEELLARNESRFFAAAK